MTVDTVLVDGVDLQSAGARIIQTWGGVHAIPEQRGNGLVVPGRHGMRDDIDRPFAAGLLSLGVLVRGASDVTGFNDAYRTLLGIVKPGRKVTLTRRLSFATGNEDHTQQARCQPFSPEMLTPADGRMVLNFVLLDGLWHGAALAPAIPATITVPGTAVTQRITLVLPGAGTLTNTTTGVSVTVTAGATLDVEDRTTSGLLSDVVAAGDPLGAWFTLQPGANTITWSGAGTPTISYSPAFL